MTDMRPAFLDHHSTTPTDPRVLSAMLPWFAGRCGNPHSVDHEWGWEAEEAVEAARRQLASALDTEPAAITFTSGATEANNLALLGLAADLKARGRTHILVSPLEHPSVAAPAAVLAASGFEVTVLPIDASGILAPGAVEAALTPRTGLVSVMAANHEIGTLQPIAEIGALCRARAVLFHSDAAQAFGKVSLTAADVDLLTLSAHKLYGPKGIGALVVGSRARPRLRPIIHGGGQEGGLRPGTVPVPLVVGFGVAADLSCAGMAAEGSHLAGLRTRLLAGLDAAEVVYELNGDPVRRLPGNLSLRFAGIDAETLIARVRDRIAISAGSACASAERIPSRTLEAIGLDREAALSSVRLGLGRDTDATAVDLAIAALTEAVSRSW
jgi:cysteine desulfurase